MEGLHRVYPGHSIRSASRVADGCRGPADSYRPFGVLSRPWVAEVLNPPRGARRVVGLVQKAQWATLRHPYSAPTSLDFGPGQL